jgi:UDP-N-acetylglucosamine 2-epimerase
LKRLKIVTIVGTRPEIIRLSRLIPKLDEHTDHILVHTGQNYDRQLNDVFFEDLRLRQPDYYLAVDTSSMGAVMGDTLRKAEEVFLKEQPDAVMILGDTNSAIAAVVAERMQIPVYHMESGNRSFDANVPEELNRKMVDHVATFNLPYNEYSMRNLLNEGIHPKFIAKSGSPILEIYLHNQARITTSRVLGLLDLKPREYFLASIHRQENVDSPERLNEILDSLQAASEHFGVPVLLSTHPRTRKRIEGFKSDHLINLIFHEPFGYLDYNKLQLESLCVISDSGTISEESSIMGFKAVCLRPSNERPEASALGFAPLTGVKQDDLVRNLDWVIKGDLPTVLPEGYEVDNFSERVFSFMMSTAPNYFELKSLRNQRPRRL